MASKDIVFMETTANIKAGSDAKSGARLNLAYYEYLEEELAKGGKKVDEKKIPIDRCFDVQWNPPGVPTLECRGLGNPYGAEPKPGDYYAFRAAGDGAKFVQVQPSGKELTVFTSVDWQSCNDEVLHFNGNGSYGTMIKGTRIASGTSSGSWTNCHRPSHSEAMQWLSQNFS